MQQLIQVIFLIDSARVIVGSDAELARRLGVSRSRIGDWRSGRYPCPAEYQVLLAEISGIDPKDTALDALVSKHEGTTLGERLAKVLGRGAFAVVVGLPAKGRKRKTGCGCTPQNIRLAVKGVG